jgi:hypothetical protein
LKRSSIFTVAQDHIVQRGERRGHVIDVGQHPVCSRRDVVVRAGVVHQRKIAAPNKHRQAGTDIDHVDGEGKREAEQEIERTRRQIYLGTDVKNAIEWFKRTYTVHPENVFPLRLSFEGKDAEADAWIEFVESIRNHGLTYPITRDKDGVIIDGQLRLIGCHLAGVEPRFETLPDGVDPGEFILGVNCMRRSYTRAETLELCALAKELTR